MSPGSGRRRRALGNHLLVVLALAAPSLASAQEPKRVQTVKVHAEPDGSGVLYEIRPDGQVIIDWDAAETLAVSKADRILLPIATVMLAIRDGTWKPAAPKK
ncbi:hypothetical protein BJ123_108142 [Rhodopseudomonas thermotolerans]|uniref:Uncharacterized protein n=2 Tax=Rhodopseudomonas TaxID=1073 RepID=A0A336JQX1_9BRAD|nr:MULTISPECIES: hypothetical protein [Rhodopseudomonas]RED36206.1 hypothetical protein BJ125_108141 [Rhodopseudomonas pentothenatexigens]REG03579.1 hypothetical protein BJ123_108142 [Rhodopseudomonas thermotolerans]SSW90766.1 hypothetical protein SAMN05892882_108141 [Rhodopseudomonas pentothenatexigens]